MMTRRELLRISAMSGASLALPWRGIVRSAAAATPIDGTALRPYIDALPVPGVLKPVGIVNGVPQYQVAMTQFKQRLHSQLKPTTLWGYAGSYPGPTIETRTGAPIAVKWLNQLPSTHLLPIDPTLHGAMGNPDVRTVVHLHGAKVLPTSDGRPEAWFTNGFAQFGQAFDPAFKSYFYPNDQQATTLWYHDHAIGITRLNVHAGLAGLYLIRDAQEDALNLPKGRYEVPLFIQDRRFNTDGSMFFPVRDWVDVDPRVPPVWSPEFFGDTITVNGKVWPYLEVEKRKYRFRIVNGSNARFYHVRLVAEGGTGTLPFVQIGADEGFLPRPVTLNDLLMAPAERFDVIVDFSKCPTGQTFVLTNDALAPYPFGPDDAPDPTQAGTTGQLMQFRVVPRVGSDESEIPTRISSAIDLRTSTGIKQRTLMLSELASSLDNVIFGLLGGSPLNATEANPTGGLHWDDPVTETPRAGSVEIWNIVNATGDAHPIHVHLVQFFVLGRQLFDMPTYLSTGKVVGVGPFMAPDANELFAPKDTVKAHQTDVVDAGMMTKIIMKFDLPNNAVVSSGERLPYVWHCHILDHEDNDMMRPYEVIV
jgi:spore coat protein A, manganese oxidase